MADSQTPPVADGQNPTAPSSAQHSAHSGPTMTPDQVAAFREAWIAAGHDPVRFDLANVPTPSAPSRGADGRYATPPAPGDAPAVQVLGNSKMPSFTPEQAAEIAESLLRSGMDPERVREALASEGVIEDTRSDEERAHDASWGFDPAHPIEAKDYDLGGIYRDYGPKNTDPVAMASVHQEVTEAMAAMKVEPATAKGLIARILEVEQSTAKLDESGKAMWKASQRAQLEQRFPPEKVQELIRQAGLAIKTAGAGNKFITRLRENSAAWHDLATVRMLAVIGARIDGWSKGGPKK